VGGAGKSGIARKKKPRESKKNLAKPRQSKGPPRREAFRFQGNEIQCMRGEEDAVRKRWKSRERRREKPKVQPLPHVPPGLLDRKTLRIKRKYPGGSRSPAGKIKQRQFTAHLIDERENHKKKGGGVESVVKTETRKITGQGGGARKIKGDTILDIQGQVGGTSFTKTSAKIEGKGTKGGIR